MALFTTCLCQIQRQSVAILEETRRAQEEDLLKRREAEETLRESEEKSRYVIESAADAIVSIDDGGSESASSTGRPSGCSATPRPRWPGSP